MVQMLMVDIYILIHIHMVMEMISSGKRRIQVLMEVMVKSVLSIMINGLVHS